VRGRKGPPELKKLKLAFNSQKCGAAKRGISFEMTFEEWLQVWRESGKIDLRGQGRGKFCMGRYNDSGPYKIGNVKIITHEQNLSEVPRCHDDDTKRRISLKLCGRKLSPSHIESIRNSHLLLHKRRREIQ
jgi:hypothetical protein